MPKPAPYRLEPANYPWSIAITTRFGDLDVNNHLNNVAIARLFEDARVRFQFEERRSLSSPGVRGLIVSVGIEYLAEAHFPDPVTVCAGFGEPGRSSWPILLAAFQHGRCFATCDSVLVLRDGNGPAPIEDEWRKYLEERQVRSG